jgi:MFS family permease
MLLKDRNFLVLWLGQLVSIFGNRFSELAIPWIVLQVTESPMKAGIVAISTQLAPLVFSIPAGVWIESLPKKKVAMISELVRTLTMTALVVFIFFGIFNIWVISSLLFFIGLAGLFFRISINSMLPVIVKRGDLVDAHNYLEGADAISTFVGPILAGTLFILVGAAWTLAIDAVSFLLSLIGISFLVFPYKTERVHKVPAKTIRSRVKDSLEGLRFLFATNNQRFISFNHSVLLFSTNAVILLVIIYAKNGLNLNVAQTGVLLSSAGLGNIIGVFILDRIKSLRLNQLYGFILFTSGLGVMMITISSNYIIVLIGIFLFDGALSMAFVLNGTARQSVTPDRLLSRVSGGGILIGGLVAIIGNAFAGGLAEYADVKIPLALCSILLFVNSLIAFKQRGMNKPIKDITPQELA